MKIISFAWTTPQLLDGSKTCTRRHWNDRYANTFRVGDRVKAYDKNPRAKGKWVATIEITAVYKERLDRMPEADVDAEGGRWINAEEFAAMMCEAYGIAPSAEVWVIRFRVLSQEVP